MNIIQTKGAPAAIGPYSQGISTGKLLFTSGQLPVNPADGAMPEGIAAQAEWSCKNVGAILEAAGSGFEKVVKTTCFLADIADFAAFNEVYARYFTSKPARSCVAVKDLPKGALCEIEAVTKRQVCYGKDHCDCESKGRRGKDYHLCQPGGGSKKSGLPGAGVRF